MSEVASTAASWREQALTVTVHRACVSCGAPGVFHEVGWIREQFPNCWVEADDPRVGQPVGRRCPHCDTLRDPGLMEHLGEIWRRRFGKQQPSNEGTE